VTVGGQSEKRKNGDKNLEKVEFFALATMLKNENICFMPSL
jgi:hypothetical protein